MKVFKNSLCILMSAVALLLCACGQQTAAPAEETYSTICETITTAEKTTAEETWKTDSTICETVTTAEKTSAEEAWKTAYKQFLEENTDTKSGGSYRYGFCQLSDMTCPFLAISDGNYMYIYLYENGEVVKKTDLYAAPTESRYNGAEWMYSIDDLMYAAFGPSGIYNSAYMGAYDSRLNESIVACYSMNKPDEIDGYMLIEDPEYFDSEGNEISEAEYEAIFHDIETRGTPVEFIEMNGDFRLSVPPC